MIGCSTILKNAVGIVGLIAILGICTIPILKLTIITIMYHLATAFCQPIADVKIVKLMEEMGGTFKILLGIMYYFRYANYRCYFSNKNIQ